MNVIVILRYHGRRVHTHVEHVVALHDGDARVTISLDDTVRFHIAPDIVNQTEANIACQLPPQHALPVDDKRRPPEPGDPTP